MKNWHFRPISRFISTISSAVADHATLRVIEYSLSHSRSFEMTLFREHV